jgi:inosine/xanthosine triphosphatase
MQLLVAVASANPVKLSAARRGLLAVLPASADIVVQATPASGDVPAQPVGDAQTQRGAVNRARGAFAGCSGAHYGLGLEGGVRESPDGLYCIAWCAIVDASGALGLASAGDFLLPLQIAELVRSGVELGHADDIVFGRTNSKHADGAIGVLTAGRITREDYYAPMVARAFVRFLRPELYA